MSEEIELIKNDDADEREKRIIGDEYIGRKKDKLNDIVITQCIVCLFIAVGMLALNIFYPEMCRELIDRYKYYSGQAENSAVNEFICNAVRNLSDMVK